MHMATKRACIDIHILKIYIESIPSQACFERCTVIYHEIFPNVLSIGSLYLDNISVFTQMF